MELGRWDFVLELGCWDFVLELGRWDFVLPWLLPELSLSLTHAFRIKFERKNKNIVKKDSIRLI